jgi:hypothetical protein
MVVAALDDPVAMPLDRPGATSFSATLGFEKALAQRATTKTKTKAMV